MNWVNQEVAFPHSLCYNSCLGSSCPAEFPSWLPFTEDYALYNEITPFLPKLKSKTNKNNSVSVLLLPRPRERCFPVGISLPSDAAFNMFVTESQCQAAEILCLKHGSGYSLSVAGCRELSGCISPLEIDYIYSVLILIFPAFTLPSD